ncbi:DUF4238 domain-containing protein [Tenacibaculum finnmarkense]|uniref:DUF4238 domain-containing protein n=1 Tax=Tenacibaculum finnmarkense TaxID=2781243 RepID=UPI001E3C9B16|nr:DUF4238 domain-containing protein [Tenacibaculum finnmarkense]MCD8413724.1 DUF4238 domain-containing protein [Tenacibaculum finnmarkense genomovar ulcerans]
MSENLVKRQHFVPRTYLKHFGVADGAEHFIHALPESETDKGKIFKSNIKNVALEKHLYTLPGETIAQKMAIEKFYSEELEQHYNSIYQILTDPTKTEVTNEQRELIISTVVTMYYRTTKWINASRNLKSRVLERAFQLCEQTGKDYFTFEGQKISIEGRELEEFTAEWNKKRQPGMVIIQLETAINLIKIRLANDGICVVRIEDDNLELVTSDNPVIAENNNPERFAPFDPSNILKLPLDSKHILMLMPENAEGLENRIFRRNSVRPFSEIEKLTSNYSQMQNSERFMFGSQSALESYLDTKQESERPLEEGESTAEIFAKLKDLGL